MLEGCLIIARGQGCTSAGCLCIFCVYARQDSTALKCKNTVLDSKAVFWNVFLFRYGTREKHLLWLQRCFIEIAEDFKGVLMCRGDDTKQAFGLLAESQNIRMQMSLLSRSAEKAHDSSIGDFLPRVKQLHPENNESKGLFSWQRKYSSLKPLNKTKVSGMWQIPTWPTKKHVKQQKTSRLPEGDHLGPRASMGHARRNRRYAKISPAGI